MSTKIIHAISGPRNISTALMYSFASRPKCLVVDEPFYGMYLKNNNVAHPGKDEILSQMPINYDHVFSKLEKLIAKSPDEIYIKNMSHHIVDLNLDWFNKTSYIFWIRHPKKVINSFAKIVDNITLKDIGYKDQFKIWNYIKNTNVPKLIVDTDDLLNDPENILKLICKTLGISWANKMLSWEKGPKSFDGVWAPYWYSNAHQTTGFKKIETKIEISKSHQKLIEQSLPYYNTLFDKRLKPI